MNRYQTSILWLGLILIALNLIVKWTEVKAVLTSSSTGGKTTSTKLV